MLFLKRDYVFHLRCQSFDIFASVFGIWFYVQSCVHGEVVYEVTLQFTSI